MVDVADADGLAEEELEAAGVLEGGRQAGPPGGQVDVGQVGAVDGDPAAGRLVHPGQQLDQRGLAGAVVADDGHHRAGRQPQVDVGQDLDVGAGVG